LKKLIRQNSRQHDRTHHGEIKRAGDAKQVHEILQYLQQRRADENANYGTFTTSQAATALADNLVNNARWSSIKVMPRRTFTET